MAAVSLMSRTETAESLRAVRVHPFIRWNKAALQSWQLVADEQRVAGGRIRMGIDPALFREPACTQFEIETLELPTASSRWALKWAGHPEVTFDDIRSGKLPGVTEQEKSQRREAIKLAKEIRQELDIRPLTVPALIRSLRER